MFDFSLGQRGKKRTRVVISDPQVSSSGVCPTGGVCCFLVAKSCLTLCDPMDGSLPGSSVHGILQARILEWVAVFPSRGSSCPRGWTWVSCIAGGYFTSVMGKSPLFAPRPWCAFEPFVFAQILAVMWLSPSLCQGMRPLLPSLWSL